MDPFQLAHHRGDVLHVGLGGAQVGHILKGDGGDGGLAAVVEVHGLHHAAFQPQADIALGAEVPLVHRLEVDAGLHQRRRHGVGVGGGVGVDKAAGVGGHGQVEGQGHILGKAPGAKQVGANFV